MLVTIHCGYAGVADPISDILASVAVRGQMDVAVGSLLIIAPPGAGVRLHVQQSPSASCPQWQGFWQLKCIPLTKVGKFAVGMLKGSNTM